MIEFRFSPADGVERFEIVVSESDGGPEIYRRRFDLQSKLDRTECAAEAADAIQSSGNMIDQEEVEAIITAKFFDAYGQMPATRPETARKYALATSDENLAAVTEFCDSRCLYGPNLRVGASALYKEYVKWANYRGSFVMSQTAFGRVMSARGFGRLSYWEVYYRGIGFAGGEQGGKSQSGRRSKVKRGG